MCLPLFIRYYCCNLLVLGQIIIKKIEQLSYQFVRLSTISDGLKLETVLIFCPTIIQKVLTRYYIKGYLSFNKNYSKNLLLLNCFRCKQRWIEHSYIWLLINLPMIHHFSKKILQNIDLFSVIFTDQGFI